VADQLISETGRKRTHGLSICMWPETYAADCLVGGTEWESDSECENLSYQLFNISNNLAYIISSRRSN